MTDRKRDARRGYRQHLLSWRSGPARREPKDPKAVAARTEIQEPLPAEEPVVFALPPPVYLTPFQVDSAVGPALSLYIRDVSPSFHRRQNRQHEGVDAALLHTLVPFIMANDVVQYANASVTLLVQDFNRTCVPRMTPEVYRLIEKTYIALRRSISEGRASLDASIWGVEALIAVWNFLGEHDKTAIHLKAMRDLLAAHGGLDALSFDGFLARTVKSYFNHFNAMQTVLTEDGGDNQGGDNQGGGGGGPHNDALPDLAACDAASQTMLHVPVGLREVIATGGLTWRCIRLVDMVAEWDMQRRMHPASPQLEAVRHLHVARCLRHLQRSRPSHTYEVLVSLAMLAYCTYWSSDVDSCWIVNCNVQLSCKGLMTQSFAACDPAVVMWAGRMLRAVYGPANMSCAFADYLMTTAVAQCVATSIPELADCQRFYWDRSLTESLRASYRLVYNV